MARHLIASDKTVRAIRPGDGPVLLLFVKGGSRG